METCPKCGQGITDTDKCPHCGVIIAAYRRYLEQVRRGPARRGAAAPVAATSDRAAPITSAAATPVAPENGLPRRLTFHGDAGTLFSIQMVNALFIILTLGVYWFWAKVKVRAYLLSETEFEGDRFHYHGNGRELFLGGLKAVLVFGVPLVVLSVLRFAASDIAPVEFVASLLSYALVVTFFAVTMFGARRYRLSRTSWRAIRFSFRGDLREFIKLFVLGSILVVFSFGLYVPIFFTRQYAYLMSRSWFGNRSFGFDGRNQALVFPYVKMLALLIPTLGLYAFWYWARQQREFADHTTFGDARCRSTVTGGGLLRLHVVNFVALALTLGLAWPWVAIRKWRYRVDNLVIEGALGLDTIVQQAQPTSGADALMAAMDVDVG